MTRTRRRSGTWCAAWARGPVVADALDPDAVARAVADGRARGDRAPAHGAVGAARHAPLRPRLRADQPAAHRGHRPPARRRPRRRRAALRGAELRGLAVRAHRRAGARPRSDPLDPDPPAALRPTLEAIRHLEAGGDRRSSGARASCCATAASTARAPRSASDPDAEHERRRSASAGSRSSATAAASGRSSTSRTPRRRPSPRSSTARAASTTSSTTSPRRSREWLPVLASALRRQAAAARPALARRGCWPARRRRS